MTEKHEVICQKWILIEKNRIEPYGYSLHLKKHNRDQFNIYLREKLGGLIREALPRSFLVPKGNPYLCEIDKEDFILVKMGQNGMKFDGQPPKRKGNENYRARA